METAPVPPTQSEALRRLIAPLLEAHGYSGEDGRRTLDDLMSALPTAVDVLDACSAGTKSRDVEILACLLAASVRGHGRIESDRLHGLLAVCETVARLLSFDDEKQGTGRARPKGER
jgi:hypothetical protein